MGKVGAERPEPHCLRVDNRISFSAGGENKTVTWLLLSAISSPRIHYYNTADPGWQGCGESRAVADRERAHLSFR